MSIGLDELEKLARAAELGPWRWGDWSTLFGTLEDPACMRDLESNLTHAGPEPYVRQRGDVCERVLHVDDRGKPGNVEYIAAASPDVVLALIERVRAAEAELARVQPVFEMAR